MELSRSRFNPQLLGYDSPALSLITLVGIHDHIRLLICPLAELETHESIGWHLNITD